MVSNTIYTTGGTVQVGDGIYLSRTADKQLLSLCQSGEFAYILTPRQMGKSSLMVETSRRLGSDGIRSVIINLTELGAQTVTAEQRYLGLLVSIVEVLDLEIDIVEWWSIHNYIGFSQRIAKFIREVLLIEIKEQIVIFVDEIDSTLNLNFTDDFFAVIRSLYVSRAQDPILKRLSFVLIGVATPSSLMSDSKRTPFNIGKRVDISDFTFSEAKPLALGFNLSSEQSEQVLGWILKWTNGHPYLTQRLCYELIKECSSNWSKFNVEIVIRNIFFGKRSKDDNNLLFVHDMLTRRSDNQSEVLLLYSQILRGQKKVLDEERSIVQSHLKLSGIVVEDYGYLVIRNPIYRKVFSKNWIKEHLPKSVIQKINLRAAANISSVIFICFLIPTAIFAEIQRQKAVEQSKIAYEQGKIADAKSQELLRRSNLIEKTLFVDSTRVAKKDLSPNVKAFLDTIAWSLRRVPGNSYRLKINDEEFSSFEKHPREKICGAFYGVDKEKVCADSAGRYHITSETWDSLSQRLKLKDFSPESQDTAVVELLRETGALNDIEEGSLETAIYKAAPDWVTFPLSKEISDSMQPSRKQSSYYRNYSVNELKLIYSVLTILRTF